MRFDKDSAEYDVNIYALQEMEEVVPMTLPERNALRKWARSGYDIESNPWNYTDAMGYELNYLQAYRIEYGYSSGPWDFWNGPMTQTLWDERRKCFIPKDEL